MRELADKEDEAASLCAALGWCGLEGLHQSDAEHHRLQADKLDPPVEWENGDLATDRNNNLWQCVGCGGVWFRFLNLSDGIVWLSTEELLKDAGPLRKVKMVPVDEHSE